MTPERLAELRALANAATPGPWWLSENDGCICSGDDGPDAVSVGNTDLNSADTAFVLASRSGTVELLDEVERCHTAMEGSDSYEYWNTLGTNEALRTERDTLKSQLAATESRLVDMMIQRDSALQSLAQVDEQLAAAQKERDEWRSVAERMRAMHSGDLLRRLLAEACDIAYRAIEDNAAAIPTTASERVQEIRREAGLGETGGIQMSVTVDCTEECERVVKCAACGRRKPPRGRDVSPYMSGSYCEHECPGHNQQPYAGHLWPGELERSK